MAKGNTVACRRRHTARNRREQGDRTLAISFRPSVTDAAGLAAVAIIGGGMFAFRQLAIVPRATVGLCAAADAPAFCAPRAAVLWLQYQQLFGWAALALGLVGFFLGRRWPAVLGIGLGLAAVVNYNATAGVIGAAFGIVTWLSLLTGRFGRPLA